MRNRIPSSLRRQGSHAGSLEAETYHDEADDSDINHGEIDKDTLLELLLSHCIEPHLGNTCIYHFPASQAALAKVVVKEGIEVAERFEFYFQNLLYLKCYLRHC